MSEILDKDLFYISLFMIFVGVAGQLSWFVFGVLPKTQASFQEMQNVSGFIMLIGFLLLPAGLFKDGIPSPGSGAKVVLGVILIIILGLGLTSILLLPSSSTTDICATSPTTCARVSILPGSSTAASTSVITFSPRNIIVILGVNATVKWMNTDNVGHTVHYLNGTSGPDSNVINPGSFYDYTFTHTGNYSYYCTIHPNMHGFVSVVQQKSG